MLPTLFPSCHTNTAPVAVQREQPEQAVQTYDGVQCIAVSGERILPILLRDRSTQDVQGFVAFAWAVKTSLAPTNTNKHQHEHEEGGGVRRGT